MTNLTNCARKLHFDHGPFCVLSLEYLLYTQLPHTRECVMTRTKYNTGGMNHL